MNLLLLLSALLSALTGVGGGVRVLAAAQSVAASSITVRVVPERRQASTLRPIAALPTVRAIAADVARGLIAVVASVPIWASRRRE